MSVEQRPDGRRDLLARAPLSTLPPARVPRDAEHHRMEPELVPPSRDLFQRGRFRRRAVRRQIEAESHDDNSRLSWLCPGYPS